MKKIAIILSLAIALILVFASCEKSEDVRGNQIGDKAYGMELSVIDENGLNGEKVDPSNQGKITIINFWGVWCPYCIYEMPDLDKIASDYSEQVTVVAVHTNSRKDEAPGFISNGYADSNIIFTLDTELDEYYGLFTDTGYYPYTVILDQEGKIISIKVGATNYAGFYEEIKDYLK